MFDRHLGSRSSILCGHPDRSGPIPQIWPATRRPCHARDPPLLRRAQPCVEAARPNRGSAAKGDGASGLVVNYELPGEVLPTTVIRAVMRLVLFACRDSLTRWP